jgi:hypothetical protein
MQPTIASTGMSVEDKFSILKDTSMSMDERLDLLEEMMLANAQAEAEAVSRATGQPVVPVDPADLMMCDGCQ